MPFSNYIPSSRIAQAGVCTSTTRPASPYEGQMIYETDTNRVLVYDNTAWVMIADTDAPPGLERITSGTLSSTATDFQGCFTSTYTNYKIVLDQLQLNNAGDIYVQMLSGSTAQSSGGNYYWAYRGLSSSSASADNGAAAQDVGYTGFSQTGANNTIVGGATLEVLNPQIAQRTFILSHAIGYNGQFTTRNGIVEHNVSTAYDGIKFTTNSAVTMGGNVTIYGYRK